MLIGKNIIFLRKLRNLTQDQLASKISVSRQTISKWENGEVVPDSINLIELSKEFNVKVDDLLLFDFEANQIDEATQPDNSDANSNGNKKFMSKFSLILGIVFITGLIIVGYLNKDKLFNEKQQIKKDSEVVVEENGNDYSKLLNAGRNFSVYVDSIGTINGYGESTYKQLNFKGWSDIVQISAGGFHTVGLKSDGSVLATGFNDFGQINASSWKEINRFRLDVIIL